MSERSLVAHEHMQCAAVTAPLTFMGYSTRVEVDTPPAASPAGCVENQLLGKQASGVP